MVQVYGYKMKIFKLTSLNYYLFPINFQSVNISNSNVVIKAGMHMLTSLSMTLLFTEEF